MEPLSMSLLEAACQAGGASALSIRTDLIPAAGSHAGVAPARFVRGSDAVYAYATRFVEDGEGGKSPQRVVQIDSKGSGLNRIEAALSQAIEAGDELLGLTPRIAVEYATGDRACDYDLPHRAFDGHIRAGDIDGTPVTATEAYRALRDCTPASVRPLLEASPVTLIFGGWDSSRKAHQGRYRSVVVGETIGVLADQSAHGDIVDERGGARVDALAASVRLDAAGMKKLLDDQRDELSESNIQRIETAIKKAKGGTMSAAALGLGAIPPSLSQLGLVSCSRIIRSNVVSFAALRQLRFGLGPEGDVSARVLLVALALAALTRSYAELTYRADCDLREAGRPVVELDARYGEVVEIAWPEIADADALLREAIAKAREFGLRWEGQVLAVSGSPLVAGGIVVDAEDD